MCSTHKINTSEITEISSKTYPNVFPFLLFPLIQLIVQIKHLIIYLLYLIISVQLSKLSNSGCTYCFLLGLILSIESTYSEDKDYFTDFSDRKKFQHSLHPTPHPHNSQEIGSLKSRPLATSPFPMPTSFFYPPADQGVLIIGPHKPSLIYSNTALTHLDYITLKM